MSKPILFTLKPNFFEGDRTFYCPECATVEGVLSYFPDVRAKLDVRHADFARPRPAVIELLGVENQGCPVLILPEGSTPSAEVHPRTANGRTFIAGARDITTHLALTMGSAFPH